MSNQIFIDDNHTSGSFSQLLSAPVGRNLANTATRTLTPHYGNIAYDKVNDMLYYGASPIWKPVGGSEDPIEYTAIASTTTVDDNGVIVNNTTHEINLINATVTNNGIVTHVDQEFGGIKTFKGIRIHENIDILTDPSTSSTGIIYKNGVRFIHDFNGDTFVGLLAGNFTNTSPWNTGYGANVLQSMTGGDGKNTAIGHSSMISSTTANNCTAVGVDTLFNNTTGYLNTAIGSFAMHDNINGHDNVAVGSSCMLDIISGSNNVGVGSSCLQNIDTGGSNTCAGTNGFITTHEGNGNTGAGAFCEAAGNWNTVMGYSAGHAGDENVAIGLNSQVSNSGSQNTTIGGYSMSVSSTTGNGNASLGYWSLRRVKGNYNVGIGYNAGSLSTLDTSLNNVYISNLGGNESGVIRIGTAGTHVANYQAGVYSSTVTNSPLTAMIGSDGLLGIVPSSRELKNNITALGDMKSVIRGLKPCSFSLKKDINNTKTFGLIAEECKEVIPEIVVPFDEEGHETIQYDKLVIFLIKEVQRLQDLTDELQDLTAEMNEKIKTLI